MKYFLVRVTGGPYFLTPCVIVQASDEESAAKTLRESNRGAYLRYRIVLERVRDGELRELAEEGCHVATCSSDIADAF